MYCSLYIENNVRQYSDICRLYIEIVKINFAHLHSIPCTGTSMVQVQYSHERTVKINFF